MAITQYGTNNAIDPNYKPIRGILTDLGYNNEDIGWDAKNNTVTLLGKPLNMQGMVAGSDQHWYADPTTIKNQLYASGVQPTVSTVPEYINPYKSQLDTAVTNLNDYMQTPFSYDPSTDKGLQQAQKDVERGIRETAGARNMLYSEGTISNIAQETSRLIPQYEQIAYGKWQDEGTRLMNFANFFDNLSQNDFNQFVQKWEMDNTVKEQQRQARLDAIDEEQRKINNAYKKLDAIDYVDNEISKITGLPVGMKSVEAQRRLQDRQWEIEDQKAQEKSAASAAARSLANEKAIIDYRAKAQEEADKKASDINYMGTPSQVSSYNTTYNSLLSSNGNDANKALQQAIINKSAYITSMGNKLYENMVSTLQDLANTQYKSLSTGQKLSYQDVYNSAVQMKNKTANGFRLYSDVDIASSVLNSGLDEPDQMEILAKLNIDVDEILSQLGEN